MDHDLHHAKTKLEKANAAREYETEIESKDRRETQEQLLAAQDRIIVLQEHLLSLYNREITIMANDPAQNPADPAPNQNPNPHTPPPPAQPSEAPPPPPSEQPARQQPKD